MPGVTTAYQTGNHAGRPAASAGCILYSCTDHGLIYRSDGSTWTTYATLGGGAPDAHAASHEDGGSDEIDVTGLVGAGGSGGEDPVADVFGAADTAFEFDTSSLTGLTVIGGAATEDADTSIPDWLFYKATDSGTAWHGRYLASPSMPFTAITRADLNPIANYMAAALIIGVANPATGAFVANEYAFNTIRKIVAEKFTNRTTWSSTLGASIEQPNAPMFLGMVANSTTSIDYYWSMTGRVWRKYLAANNPSLTVGSVGVAMKSENAAGAAAAFDYLRLWNSAKTFPGA